jgi:hypothetical protein
MPAIRLSVVCALCLGGLLIAARAQSLISQDSVLLIGDTRLNPFALLANGDRIYTPAGSFGDRSLRMVSQTSAGFRRWDGVFSTDPAGSYIDRMYDAVLSGDTTAVYMGIGNGLWVLTVDRSGNGKTISPITGNTENRFWPPASFRGDTLVAGGKKYRASSDGENVLTYFTKGGKVLGTVAMTAAPGYVEAVAKGEGKTALLFESEITGEGVVRKIFVRKVDGLGATVWRKPYDGGPDAKLNDVAVLHDGYLFCGYAKETGPDNHDYWWFKTDFDGDTVWSRRGGDRWDDQFNTIQPATGGGFLLGGQITAFNVKKELFGFVLRVDAMGNPLWSARLGASSVLRAAEPESGTFHFLGGPAWQRNWFGILSPEGTIGLAGGGGKARRISATGSPAGMGFRPRDRWRADGRRIAPGMGRTP